MVPFKLGGRHAVLTVSLVIAAAAACGTNTGSTFDPGGDGGAPDGSDSGGGGFLNDGLNGPEGGSNVVAPQSLTLSPANAVVVVDGTGAKTTSFTLTAVDANGVATNVVADSVAFDRPDLATVAIGASIVTTAPAQSALFGGTGNVHAIYHGKEATASLTVRVQVADYGQGLSATSPGVVALGGASLPADPKANALLYPYDKTVWPLGLTSPLLMWSAPQAGDVYHLHYAEKNYIFDGYYTVDTLPAQLRLPQSAWDRITASNDAAHGSDPLAFSLSRWDHTANTAYALTSQTWTVAPANLQGAIYYWTASQNSAGARIGHISRFQLGSGATPQALNNGVCMGCHAVNARGTVLVADVDDQVSDGTEGAKHTTPSVAPYDNWSGTRAWASFDIAQPSAPLTYQSNKFGGNVALTPDGTYLVFGGPAAAAGSKYLSLGVVATGNVVANSGLDLVTGFSPGETNLEMPAFSPDGTKLAVVESHNPDDRDNVLPGMPETIAYLGFDQNAPSGPTFDPQLHAVVDGTSPIFAETGGGLGYPSFTPDSNALAFHAGHTSTGCTGACDDSVTDDGNLFVTRLASPSPIRLAAACDPPNTEDKNASVEPTFNPVQRGGYSWAVFTSMRAWGNKPWPSDVTGSGHVNGKRRLWVTPVDATLGTSDPSHPAIYLEGQEDTPNMRGFWTLSACVATPPAGSPAGAGACTAGFNCCSGFCKDGTCVDVSKVACTGLGGACTTAADCCNGGSVACTNGTCSPVVN